MLLLFCAVETTAQNKQTENSFFWPYNLPAHIENGPDIVVVHAKYYFTKERFGEKYFINLHFKIDKILFEIPPSYRHEGLRYTHMQINELDKRGLDGFQDINITQISLQFPAISGLGILDAKEIKLGGVVGGYEGSIGGYHIATCEKNLDLNKLRLGLAGSFAYSMNWNGSSNLKSRIENALKHNKNKEEYKNVIRDADNALFNKQYEDAKILYKKAIDLMPNESYPKTKLSEIEKKLADQKQKEKQQADKAKVTENKSQSEQNKTNNNSESSQNKTKSSTTLSEKVKVNGEYVQVFKKDGVPYVRYPDGRVQKTSEAAYDKILMVSEEQQKKAQRSEQTQVVKQPTKEEMIAKLNTDFEEKQRLNKEFEDKLVSKTQGLVSSFYQGQAAANSYQNIKDLGQLKGNYNSVEELESAFNQQYNTINTEANNYVQNKTAAINSYVNSTDSSTPYAGAMNESMKLLGSFISQAQANKAAKEAREKLAADRQIQLNQINNAKIKARVDLRTKLFESFPNGGLPLSSHKIEANNVYMFAYIADKNQIAQEFANVSVSNVFSIARYSDGTFPYKTSILDKLKGRGQGEIVMVGYYTDEQVAIKMHTSFTNLAQKTTINTIPFTVKSDTRSNEVKNMTDDFWENGKKPEKQKIEKQKVEKKSDFWDN